MGHVASCGVIHLPVLEIIGGFWKEVEITDMVIMKVSDDHVFDFGRVNADEL